MALPHTRVVSFGDCDPAGIVYYPNIFRWLDATFHVQLRPFGGHGAVCAQLGSVGLGLVDVSAQFRSPLRDGDHLTILPRFAQWGRKTLTLEYEGKNRAVGNLCRENSGADGLAGGRAGVIRAYYAK